MLQTGLQQYLSPAQRKALGGIRIGIAGVGGLGSNVAMLLARSGIMRFVLVDGDSVEPSNLNRQCFFPQHVGMPKVDAMTDILHSLQSEISVEKHCLWLDAENTPPLLSQADIWVEALDAPYMKRDFVELALQAEVFVVSASGLAGWGGLPMEKRVFGKNLVVVGDFTTGVDVQPPLAPRVVQAAAMQADAVLERILGPAMCDAYGA